jgi:ferredoxin--NADP+ reductase
VRGYLSSHLADLPFEPITPGGPQRRRRVLDADWMVVDALCHRLDQARPIGLIGTHQIRCGRDNRQPAGDLPGIRRPRSVTPMPSWVKLAAGGVDYTTWEEWERLDAHELELGARQGRNASRVAAARE